MELTLFLELLRSTIIFSHSKINNEVVGLFYLCLHDIRYAVWIYEILSDW